MKRWLYIGGGAVFGILILIAVGLYFFVSSLDSIVKGAIENYGSEITQAPVRVREVKIEIASGKGTLRGFTVGNPPGFKSEWALSFEEIDVELDVGSVTKDPVVIKVVSIVAPDVTYEYGLKGSNIDALKRNVDAYTSQGTNQKESGARPPAGQGGQKLVIEKLVMRDGKVNASLTEIRDRTASAPFPVIQLSGIGRKTGGATAGELAEQLLGAIAREATRAAASTDLKSLLANVKGGAAGISQPGAGAAKGGRETVNRLLGK